MQGYGFVKFSTPAMAHNALIYLSRSGLTVSYANITAKYVPFLYIAYTILCYIIRIISYFNCLTYFLFVIRLFHVLHIEFSFCNSVIIVEGLVTSYISQ